MAHKWEREGANDMTEEQVRTCGGIEHMDGLSSG